MKSIQEVTVGMASAFVFILSASGCCERITPTSNESRHANDESSGFRSSEIPVSLVEQFRAHASKSEINQYEALVSDPSASGRRRAAEMVLFKLSAKELGNLGIHQIEQEAGHYEWYLAFSRDTDEEVSSISEVLNTVAPDAWCLTSHHHAGWYVPREQFFQAQEALLKDQRIRMMNVIITTPKLGQR